MPNCLKLCCTLLLFCFIVGCDAPTPTPTPTPQEYTGNLSFDRALDGNNTKQFMGDLWELATSYPKATTICVNITVLIGNDKYGNAVTGKEITFLEDTELNELRRYTSKNYAIQNGVLMSLIGKKTVSCPSDAVHLP